LAGGVGEGCAGFFWVEDDVSGEEGGFWFAGGFWARSAKPELNSRAASASPTRLFHGRLGYALQVAKLLFKKRSSPSLIGLRESDAGKASEVGPKTQKIEPLGH
jgi:hypothetical protein